MENLLSFRILWLLVHIIGALATFSTAEVFGTSLCLSFTISDHPFPFLLRIQQHLWDGLLVEVGNISQHCFRFQEFFL